MSDFFEILRVAGPWGGPVLIFGLLYARGHIATGRECTQLRDELALERQERAAERVEFRQEISYWRDLTWSFSRIADQVTGALPLRKDSK